MGIASMRRSGPTLLESALLLAWSPQLKRTVVACQRHKEYSMWICKTCPSRATHMQLIGRSSLAESVEVSRHKTVLSSSHPCLRAFVLHAVCKALLLELLMLQAAGCSQKEMRLLYTASSSVSSVSLAPKFCANLSELLSLTWAGEPSRSLWGSQ